MSFAIVPGEKEIPWWGQVLEGGGVGDLMRTAIRPSWALAKEAVPWLENLDPEKLHFFETRGSDYTIRPMHGLPTEIIDPDTKANYGIFVYDQEMDVVYNGEGRPLGRMLDFLEEKRKRLREKGVK
jgi:hypothetical protein